MIPARRGLCGRAKPGPARPVRYLNIERDYSKNGMRPHLPPIHHTAREPTLPEE